MMKLALILMFFSYWTNTIVMVNSNACTDQSYVPDSHKNVKNKFISEYSFLSAAKRKFYLRSGPKEISIQDYEMARPLCACALHKLSKQKNGVAAKSVREISQNMIYSTSKIGVYISPYCYIIPFYEHHFPAIYCVSTLADVDSCLIAKGPQKKSNEKQVHNIYLANVKGYYDDDPLYDFLGFIENVDLEKLASEIRETSQS